MTETAIVPPVSGVTKRGARRSWYRPAGNTVRVLCLLAVLVWCFFPFLWLFMTSLKKTGAGASGTALFEGPFSWDNYAAVFEQGFIYNLRNSLIVATSSMLICVTIGTLAAYALTKLNIRHTKLIMMAVLALSLFPAASLVPPLYSIWRNLGLLNTYPGMFLPYSAFGLPLSIFLLTTIFATIPDELSEAAEIDGASPLRTFYQVVLPLAAPGIFTAAIISFVAAWNEYLLASTFAPRSLAAQTVPVAIASFSGTDPFERPIGTITAACIIVVVPMIVMALIFQRRIVSGLAGGAVKG